MVLGLFSNKKKDLSISMVGRPQSGKTTFLTILYGLLNMRQNIRPYDSDSIRYVNMLNLLRIFPPKAEKYLDTQIRTFLKGLNVQATLRETYNEISYMMQMKIKRHTINFKLDVPDMSGEIYDTLSEIVEEILSQEKHSAIKNILYRFLSGEAITNSMALKKALTDIQEIIKNEVESLKKMAEKNYNAYIVLIDINKINDIDEVREEGRRLSNYVYFIMAKHFSQNYMLHRGKLIKAPLIIALSKAEELLQRTQGNIDEIAYREFKNKLPMETNFLKRVFKNWNECEKTGVYPVVPYSAFGPEDEPGKFLSPRRLIIPLIKILYSSVRENIISI